MQTEFTHVIGDGHEPFVHAGRWQKLVEPHTYGAGHGELELQLMITHWPKELQRSAPPQSALVVQSRMHAAN